MLTLHYPSTGQDNDVQFHPNTFDELATGPARLNSFVEYVEATRLTDDGLDDGGGQARVQQRQRGGGRHGGGRDALQLPAARLPRHARLAGRAPARAAAAAAAARGLHLRVVRQTFHAVDRGLCTLKPLTIVK